MRKGTMFQRRSLSVLSVGSTLWHMGEPNTVGQSVLGKCNWRAREATIYTDSARSADYLTTSQSRLSFVLIVSSNAHWSGVERNTHWVGRYANAVRRNQRSSTIRDTVRNVPSLCMVLGECDGHLPHYNSWRKGSHAKSEES